MYILVCIYSIFPTHSYEYARGHPRKRVPIRVPTHALTRALAEPPRTTAAPHRRPAERVRRGVHRRSKAAHTMPMFDPDAVFHAPMFALNAAAFTNACKPSHAWSAPTERARTVAARIRGARTHTQTRAYAHTWARLCGRNASAHKCRYTHRYRYMHLSCISTL